MDTIDFFRPATEAIVCAGKGLLWKETKEIGVQLLPTQINLARFKFKTPPVQINSTWLFPISIVHFPTISLLCFPRSFLFSSNTHTGTRKVVPAPPVLCICFPLRSNISHRTSTILASLLELLLIFVFNAERLPSLSISFSSGRYSSRKTIRRPADNDAGRADTFPIELNCQA